MCHICQEISKQNVKRAEVISENRRRRIKGLPSLPVPDKVPEHMRRVAYTLDGDYCFLCKHNPAYNRY